MTGWTACAAVVPCANEGGSIAALVGALRRYLPVVIVVDDGSTDNTPTAAGDAGARVICHEENRGKGAALRTGLSAAQTLGCDWAVTLDGDGQHVPDDLPHFLQAAQQTGALLVVGNRMHHAHAMPWLRRLVNRWMSRQLSRRAGRRLPDSQCGFRMVHLESWAGLGLKTEHFEIESEMLMSFLAAEHPVTFVPIQVIGRARGSHIRPVADAWRWWKWWRGWKPGSSRRATLDRPLASPPPGYYGLHKQPQ